MSLPADLAARIDGWLRDGAPPALVGERRDTVASLAGWIAARLADDRDADVLFVCTHNSRRSHLGQLWARAAALHLGLDRVRTFSAGTEATAFEGRAVAALRAQGFPIAPTDEVLGVRNRVHAVSLGRGTPERAFSKTLTDPSLPRQGFAAVMVCTDADLACPFVPGADLRISLPYADPKASDGTPEETETYLARSEEIGRELAWLMALAARGPASSR